MKGRSLYNSLRNHNDTGLWVASLKLFYSFVQRVHRIDMWKGNDVAAKIFADNLRK